MRSRLSKAGISYNQPAPNENCTDAIHRISCTDAIHRVSNK